MDSLQIQLLLSVLILMGISFRVFEKKSLNASGIFMGVIVMAIHFVVGYRFGALLLVLFMTSSMATKYQGEKKRSIDLEFK